MQCFIQQTASRWVTFLDLYFPEARYETGGQSFDPTVGTLHTGSDWLIGALLLVEGFFHM